MIAGKPKRILCVDDSQDNCELLRFILSDEGCQVELASSIAQGMQLAQSGSFDLYLLDLSYEDGSGFDLIQGIRAFDPFTPIIVCSGDSRDAIPEAVKQAGGHAFLLKPFDPDTLVQTVSDVFGEPLPAHN